MPKPVSELLFLARFAPLEPMVEPVLNTDWGITPYYHHRLHRALEQTGLRVICAQEPAELIAYQDKVDFVYSIYNRGHFRNSEVLVSSMCSYLGLPCLGGHPNSRAIAEDKHLFKLLMTRLGIQTPMWVKIDSWDNLQELKKVPLPAIVKQRFGADSAGISEASVAFDNNQLVDLTIKAQSNETPVIVEEFIRGVNLTVGALGTVDCEVQDVVAIETDLPDNLQTYNQKKFGSGLRTKSIFENNEVSSKITKLVKAIFGELRPLDYFRCDFRYEPNSGALYILELNASCDLQTTSSFAVSAQRRYPDYDRLVAKILDISFNRQGLAFE